VKKKEKKVKGTGEENVDILKGRKEPASSIVTHRKKKNIRK